MMAFGKVKVWIVMAFGLGALNLGSEEVDLNLPEGFEAHRIYDVPVKTQGSWVCITFDPQGRLIASSQFGGLYRLTLPPLKEDRPPLVETMNVDVGAAQGLLWAFDSLYVVVNGTSKSGRQSGLYRVRDSDGDDQIDEVSLLRQFKGAGEHGPHALSLTPDGKRIFVLAGNATEIPEPLDDSRVPKIWADDHILPREQYRDSIIGPDGAWVCITDPDGSYWELFCRGMRNPYDIALDRGGNLFTWDSDNERDTGQPWYRPTRVCYLASGGDYGWRSGSGKWPKYYKDSLPPAVEMGTGSPTGIVFGYGTHFPTKYRNALFVLDWSFGSIEAVFPEPDGAGFTGRSEVFASGDALPVTDAAVGQDGALYFTTGGRGMDSFLYRIRHRSPDFDEVSEKEGPENELAAIRQELDSYHVSRDPAHIDKAWPHLGSGDRFVAASARTILEHHEPDHWRERVFEGSDPVAKINGLIALARTGKKRDRETILRALNVMEVESLDEQGILDLLRAYQLSFTRFGIAPGELAKATANRLEKLFPSDTFFINRELSRLLVYLESPQVIAKSLDLLTKGRTQEEQIHFALVLRLVKKGWTPDQRKTYFRWFNHAAASYRGGAGVVNQPSKSERIFKQVFGQIRSAAISTLTSEEKTALKEILEGGDAAFKPKLVKPASGGVIVRRWKVADLVDALDGLESRNFMRGRSMYTAASCAACHQFIGEGQPIGPDLSSVVARFNHRALLESIIEPNKVISDQYQQTLVVLKDGSTLTGTILENRDGILTLQLNPLVPNAILPIDSTQVERLSPSPVSSMPASLLDTLNWDEVMDLMAYLLSRGNPNDAVFQ